MKKIIDGEEVIEITHSAFKRMPGGIYLHNYYTQKIKYFRKVKKRKKNG